MKLRCSRTPRSCLSVLPVNEDEARVSSAVEPPSAISHPLHIANMYEKAAVARCSGDALPTITTENVCSEFWRQYARMTGIDPLNNTQNS